MHLALPEALLLLPLAALLLRGRLWPRPFVGVLRVLLLVAVALALAAPWWQGLTDGRDVVLVLDRSRSMPANGLAGVPELSSQLGARAEPGDRFGLVGFGRKPVVDLVPQAAFSLPPAPRPVDPDGSDLAAAIDAALALLPPGRQGSLLVVSDGEADGGDLGAAARAALRRGVRIDAVLAPRPVGQDVAVADVQAPNAVAVGEPFVVTAVVAAGAPGPAHWRLFADSELVREGDAELVAGRNVLQFRRALAAPGLQQLAVEVHRDGDPVPQNDRGLAVVRGLVGPRVLCITPGGREDRLSGSLRAAGLDVVIAAPGTAPLSMNGLDAFRCVVLENVAASELATGALSALASFVRDQGGGLLMTGGKASYGVGGYHRSPVEDVLPVTMEMREEQRRFGLAMAIALDRSGSMQMDAGGTTKMQLADRGAATAVEMLSPIDSVAVIAIDSAPHVVVPLGPVVDKPAIQARCRSIESMGGGIFVGEALHAAAAELARSTQKNRHIVLFADAADSEEPGDYKSFVPGLVKAGVTVSVIGLGTPADSDAALLQEIAKLGNGRCHFVADAADLPRVFARETIQVARSAVVEEPTDVAALPALLTLGELPATFPRLSGYSLAWRRPRADVDLVTTDRQAAPALTHWQCGLGRAAAFLGEADGPLSGGLATWGDYGGFFGTLARWLCGGQLPGVFVEARRDGSRGRIGVEVEAGQEALLDAARGVVTTPVGTAADLVFERIAPGRLEAVVPLDREGVFRAAVQLGNATLRVPPLCLPYSPEYAPQTDPRAGERALRRLAATTGGRLQPTAEQVLEGDRRGAGRVDVGRWCGLAAVLLLLAEIAVRRFGVFLPALRWPRRREVAVPAAAGPAPAPAVPPAPTPLAPPVPPPAPPAAPAPDGGGMLGALSRAKRKGERR